MRFHSSRSVDDDGLKLTAKAWPRAFVIGGLGCTVLTHMDIKVKIRRLKGMS